MSKQIEILRVEHPQYRSINSNDKDLCKTGRFVKVCNSKRSENAEMHT